MPLPAAGSILTQDQINASVNLDRFPGSTPGGKNWHKGLFEPWALSFGYEDGQAMYANVDAHPGDHHICYLNDGHQAPIILKRNETPATYGIAPT
jgi:hypothetical protein